ncbi:MAG: penicillin-binding protein 1A [Pseudomonadota bacterium]|nr:penicillin-binding protein 1A [Pseudomonadota bacterium]
MLRAFLTIIGLLLIIGTIGAGGVFYVFYEFGRALPDYHQLADYEPPVMTRVHAGDGRLLAEYAIEKRVFVPIGAMPRRVINAFLAAEDKNFYTHPGIDFAGIVRAVVTNVKNLGESRRPVGASTITQQVAKNFLLTNEVSWSRKIKEAILAFRIERAFEKGRILELYLNEIYLGFSSYGVALAALNYFNKSMDELTIAEAAFLAALPKAPNNYNPVTKPVAARARRDWVIGRMQADRFITSEEAELARHEPFEIRHRSETEFVSADYFAEEVRRELAERYGEEELYKGGLSARTTVDPTLQNIAEKALRDGLISYDRRHGWRGPVTTLPGSQRLDDTADWRRALAQVERPKGFDSWLLAAVLGSDEIAAHIGLDDGAKGTIPLAELTWARVWMEGQKLGPKIKAPGDVLSRGQVVAVEPVILDADGNPYPERTYGLRQQPEINGGLVVMDPHTGRVLAMAGGYSYEQTQFNRVTQARRQPGSAFKPVVYLAALDSGYTPATLILDAPFVIDQGPGLPKWRPANYTRKFYGPSTMRLGIEKSRNLMTVRMAQTIGMEKVAEYAEKLGVVNELPETLAMALGAGETTLMRLTTAYAMFVNGGKRVTPTLIDRIQDRHGATVFRHDRRNCLKCRVSFWTGQEAPVPPDVRPQVTTPASAYQVVSMLQGVVLRGTGKRVRTVGKPLAGKTGTTNQERDTWFIGFTPDLAVGVFAGFDTPRPLGYHETGSSVAAPIFRRFMVAALKDKPAIPFRIPPGIRLVRIDGATGRLARAGDQNVILEAFKPGTEPTGREQVLEGESWSDVTPTAVPILRTGGLY